MYWRAGSSHRGPRDKESNFRELQRELAEISAALEARGDGSSSSSEESSRSNRRARNSPSGAAAKQPGALANLWDKLRGNASRFDMSDVESGTGRTRSTRSTMTIDQFTNPDGSRRVPRNVGSNAGLFHHSASRQSAGASGSQRAASRDGAAAGNDSSPSISRREHSARPTILAEIDEVAAAPPPRTTSRAPSQRHITPSSAARIMDSTPFAMPVALDQPPPPRANLAHSRMLQDLEAARAVVQQKPHLFNSAARNSAIAHLDTVEFMTPGELRSAPIAALLL